MLEEVVGVQPNMCDLEAACRHLVRTSTFVPSIAEILAELKKQHELFEDRWGAADYIGDWQAKLKKVLAKAKDKHANDTH